MGITFKSSTSVGGRIFGSLFFLSFLGMGLLFCVFIGREVYLNALTYRWTRADCVILESRVQDDANRENPYRFQVRYEYEWQGRTHSSEKWSRRTGGHSTYDEAQALVTRYPLDSKAACYVNPSNPSEALLERPGLWMGFMILLPLIFVAIGGIGLVAMWSKKAEAVEATKPVRTKPISSVGSSQTGTRFAIGFFGLFLFIGVVVFYFITLQPLLQVLSARSWVVTPCTIVSSRVQTHRGDDSTTYRVDILYRYEVDGQEHRSSRFKFMGGSSSGFKSKAEIVAQYPEGAQRTCFVNPRNPAEAVLQRGLTADMWFGAIPAVFMLVGGGGILAMVRKGASEQRQRYNAAADVTPVPVSEIVGVMAPTSSVTAALFEDSSGSRVLKPASSRLAMLIVMGAFAAIWNGVLWFLFLPDTGAFRRGSVGAFDIIHFIFLLPFLAVGLVLIGVVVYQWLALYNPKAEITITPGLPALGGRLELAWRLTGRTHVLRDLKIVLEAREEATYRRGTRTYTDRKVFLKLDAASANDPGSMSEGRATIVLPIESVPTFSGKNNKIVWGLTVTGEIPRWPNLKEEFVIEVRPPAVSVSPATASAP